MHYTPKFGTRILEIEIDNEVYHQLMADKKHDEIAVKETLKQDIDFIYNHMRLEWNHKNLPTQKHNNDHNNEEE